jgi:hypothetical protein
MVDAAAWENVDVIRDGLRRVGGRNGIRWMTLAIRVNIVVVSRCSQSEAAGNRRKSTDFVNQSPPPTQPQLVPLKAALKPPI